MGISISVDRDGKSTTIHFCDRCKKEGLSNNDWVRLHAIKPDGEDDWDLCPDCYSEVMEGAICIYSER